MTAVPNIEVNADKVSTIVMGFFCVVLLIVIPWHIAQWVQGGIRVSRYFGWENYPVLALALYVTVHPKTQKGIRLIAVLVAALLVPRLVLHLAHASNATWHLAAWGLAFANIVCEVAILIGMSIWFKNRVRFDKAPHNA